MVNTPKHRVILFALSGGSLVWDADDKAVVEKIVETDDLAEAMRLTREAIMATGSHSAASLSPAVERFDDLGAYLEAQNFGATLCEELSLGGAQSFGMTSDLAHWAEIGVRTPQDLADYLDGCFEREMQKQAMAG